jgi:ribokinase
VEAALPDRVLRLPALPVTVADTTGAGDCFVGVFAAALDRGAAVGTALHRASVAAGLSCTRPGSQSAMPGAAETDRALPQLPPTPP